MKCKVSTRGLTELGATFKALINNGAESAIRDAINETSIEILKQSQENIKASGSQSSGKLFNSGRIVGAKTTGKGNKFRVQGSVAYDAKYAYWVEFGRRAGKMPPVDSLYQWVRKKGLVDKENVKLARAMYKKRKKIKKHKTSLGQDLKAQQRSIAFAIAKSIGRKGTKAQPFLKPALLAERAKFQERLKHHIEEYFRNVAKK